MTVFHWVRHAPTHQKAFVGWRDVSADVSDTDQIARLQAHLPQDALVVSSDLRRCTQTADAIAGKRTRLAPMPGLRELHFGAWDGQHWKTIAERHPVLSRMYWEKPGDLAPPGGESWNAAMHRVSTAADQLARITQGREIIVVAHFGAILTQVQRGLGCTAYEAMAHKIDNWSVTTIAWQGETAEVRAINHLP